VGTRGGWNAGRSPWPVGRAWRSKSLQRGLRARGRYTWRHTATSLPWTATCSAGNTMGA